MYDNLNSKAKKRALSTHERDVIMSRLIGVTDADAFGSAHLARADMVIEAVYEDLAIKHKVRVCIHACVCMYASLSVRWHVSVAMYVCSVCARWHACVVRTGMLVSSALVSLSLSHSLLSLVGTGDRGSAGPCAGALRHCQQHVRTPN